MENDRTGFLRAIQEPKTLSKRESNNLLIRSHTGNKSTKKPPRGVVFLYP